MREPREAKRKIPPHERLIVALDVPSTGEALGLADALGDDVSFYKLGLELAFSGRYFELIEELRGRGKRIFADVKLHDIPATVAAAVRQLARREIDFVTVHGGDPAMLAAASGERRGLRLLAVTVLTSVGPAELAEAGIGTPIEELVIARARQALAAGCAGVVASGREAAALRAALGEDFLIVAPGIRQASRRDDQRRVVSPREAFANGADYIVVGRPVRDAPDPRAAARAIQETIAEHFGSRPPS